MVCSVQTVHLSCTDTNTVSKRTKTTFHTTHVTYEFHRVRPKLLILVQTMHLSYVKLPLSPNELNRAPPEPHHLGVSSGASKTIDHPMVRSVQTVHLSCVEVNTIFAQTKQNSAKALSLIDANRVPILH
jgi:hypothetical protein